MPDTGLTLLKNTRYGKMLFFKTDQYIGRSFEVYGEFSVNESVVFAQILRAGDIAIDVGANIGAHTLHFARLVGPTGWIFAFEPQRVIHQLLCANMALNEVFNVHALQAAAGDAAGMLYVPPLDFAHSGNFGGHGLSQTPSGERVPVAALDTLELPSLRLLKIDVEGMECGVLRGARQLIARHRPFLYVENDRREHSAALITLLSSLGYTLWWHLPRLYNPHNFYGNAENVFGNIVSINLLCVPEESDLAVTEFRRVSGPDDWFENW